MDTRTNNPFDKEIEIDNKQIIARPDNEPMEWANFARQNYLTGTPIAAEELVNAKFDILRAKRFDSSFDGQDHAWYCIVRKVDDTEIFSVTLGGQAVVEVLDAYSATGSDRPLRVTLSYTKGGKYNGYYSFI